MANITTELGDISLPVGSYESGDKIKKRYRRLGTLMQTEYEDGGKNMWIKLNGDALSSSLLILARAHMDKGADTVLLSVFAKKEKEE
jgi:hypothetical protein